MRLGGHDVRGADQLERPAVDLDLDLGATIEIHHTVGLFLDRDQANPPFGSVLELECVRFTSVKIDEALCGVLEPLGLFGRDLALPVGVGPLDLDEVVRDPVAEEERAFENE